jgi:uncharacterized protein (TIGR03437 family)
MIRRIATLLPALFGFAAFAATTQTTLTATNGKVSLGQNVTLTASVTLTNIGSGTFSASVPLDPSLLSGTNINAPYVITLSGGSDTITGTLTIPTALVTGTATTGTGSATVTGGSGNYAGATGSFPTLTGSVTGNPITGGGTVSFTGAGSITTGGSGGGGGPTTPTITAVLDAGSYTSNIAQGSIFVVKGTGLSSNTGLEQFSFPLPTTSTDGVKITFSPTNGDQPVTAYLIYEFNQGGVNQLAAVLPSTIGAGRYNVIVTNGTANSTGFAVTVVARKFAMLTQDATGSGLVVAQNFISASQLDVNRFTTGTISGITISPAKPGQVIIVYGTGMGPTPGADNVASPGYNFLANGVTVQVVVGGVTVPAQAAVRVAGLSGLDQVNVQLPSNVPTGCTVPVQVSVNGTLSSPTFVAIAPDAASSACVQPGFTTQQLQSFDNGGSITTGAFVLAQIAESVTGTNVKIDTLGGGFTRYTGFQLASLATSTTSQASVITSGSCSVTHFTGAASQITTGGAQLTSLDAGNITVTGPSGSGLSNFALTEDAKNIYSSILGEEGLPGGISLPGAGNATLTAGPYTLNGAGGKDIGKFTATVTLGTPLTITGGLPTSINRSAGLTLNWTGGNATDTVEVVGYSGTLTGSGATATIDANEFICITTAGAKTLTVSPAILTQLSPVAAGSTTQTGFLEVVSTPVPAANNGLFQAPLTAGGNIDTGLFLALIGFGGPVSYQ